jgi:hypothetical protein
MGKVLIANAVATNATKVQFELVDSDFKGAQLPSVKTRGLGTGDSVKIYEYVNADWELGKTLDESTKSTTIRSPGLYAVDITMATAGPAHCELSTSRFN